MGPFRNEKRSEGSWYGFIRVWFTGTLPNIVFTSDNLTELKLAGCDIKPQGQIQLRWLKKFSLKQIWLVDKLVDRIFSGCPLLESLSIIECVSRDELNFDCPNIKNLLAIFSNWHHHFLKISCPNLMSMEIVGPMQFISLMNVSSLVTASVANLTIQS